MTELMVWDSGGWEPLQQVFDQKIKVLHLTVELALLVQEPTWAFV